MSTRKTTLGLLHISHVKILGKVYVLYVRALRANEQGDMANDGVLC